MPTCPRELQRETATKVASPYHWVGTVPLFARHPACVRVNTTVPREPAALKGLLTKRRPCQLPKPPLRKWPSANHSDPNLKECGCPRLGLPPKSEITFPKAGDKKRDQSQGGDDDHPHLKVHA